MEIGKELSVLNLINVNSYLFSRARTLDEKNIGLKTTWDSKMKLKEEREKLKSKIK